MALTKRIAVSLHHDDYSVLRAIADSTGKPMSTFLSEMVHGARPTLERMAATFQKVKVAQDAERSRFLSSIDDAQTAIEPVIAEVLEQFDLFLSSIDRAVDTVGGSSVGVAGALPPTVSTGSVSPPTNRGDTPHFSKPRKASNGKASKPVLKKQVLKKT